jgi:DNA-binding beta-propeller fold protein YncE
MFKAIKALTWLLFFGCMLSEAQGAIQLFVSNQGDNTIRKVDSTGTQTVFFSGGGIDKPQQLAFDALGNLLVVNYENGWVQKISATGQDLGGFSTGLSRTYGLAIDSLGNILVSSFDNSSIKKFSPMGTDLGIFGPAPANQTGFLGLAFDTGGNLYVANNTFGNIHKISPTGQDLGIFVSTGPIAPTALAFDSSGNMLVSFGFGMTIRRYSSSGQDLGVFASGFDFDGLALDADDNLFAAKINAGGIQKFTASGLDLGEFSGGFSTPTFITLQNSPVPEPGSLLLFGSLFAGLFYQAQRAKRGS